MSECPQCKSNDEATIRRCQRLDCPYHCDPILTDWDAELVETEGAAPKTSEDQP
jgi:hypothetical protein